METSKNIVIAGNLREYTVFLRSKGVNHNKYPYVYMREHVIGHMPENLNIFMVGNYFLNPVHNSDEIQLLRKLGAKVTYATL